MDIQSLGYEIIHYHQLTHEPEHIETVLVVCDRLDMAHHMHRRIVQALLTLGRKFTANQKLRVIDNSREPNVRYICMNAQPHKLLGFNKSTTAICRLYGRM